MTCYGLRILSPLRLPVSPSGPVAVAFHIVPHARDGEGDGLRDDFIEYRFF